MTSQGLLSCRCGRSHGSLAVDVSRSQMAPTLAANVLFRNFRSIFFKFLFNPFIVFTINAADSSTGNYKMELGELFPEN